LEFFLDTETRRVRIEKYPIRVMVLPLNSRKYLGFELNGIVCDWIKMNENVIYEVFPSLTKIAYPGGPPLYCATRDVTNNTPLYGSGFMINPDFCKILSGN